MANHACVEIARRAIRNLRTRQVSERMAGTSISVASPRLGFVPQEELLQRLRHNRVTIAASDAPAVRSAYPANDAFAVAGTTAGCQW